MPARLRIAIDLNDEMVGLTLGGGAVYWFRRRVGVRVEAFGIAPIRDEIRTGRYRWDLRGGVAIRIR